MYEVHTPELVRNIYIDTHVVAMVCRWTVLLLVVLLRIPYDTDRQRVGSNILFGSHSFIYTYIHKQTSKVKKMGSNVQIHSIRMYFGRRLSNA
jgi:hypothetical protein